MKISYSILSLILVLIVCGCGNNSTNSTTPNSTSSQVRETINGTYTDKQYPVEFEISIRGDRWYGKTVIISGMGSDYDNQNAEYDNGIVSGNDLYDSSGMVKIGYVSGNRVITSYGGQRVTLRKN